MMRTYEAAVAVIVMLLSLVQFVVMSAGRLGEQWDSTELDVEVKRALEDFQSIGTADAFEKYSKLRDPDLLRMPRSEGIGFSVLFNGEPVDKSVPPEGVEVAATDARIFHNSRDEPKLVPALYTRLLRSDYVQLAGRSMDYDSVDELAQLIISLQWDEASRDILEERVQILLENQNPDDGWGFVYGEESDALCTSMAVRALAGWFEQSQGDPMSDAAVSGGIEWLRERVHADGGYGSREWIESSVDMTGYALLAFVEAGLDATDPWVAAAMEYLLRMQRPDGGFPLDRRSGPDSSATAVALEALMAAQAPQSAVASGFAYLGGGMVSDGNFTLVAEPSGESGTYDIKVDTGYILDSEPRGYEFWGNSWDDSIVAIVGVFGTRENLTVILRIERGRLEDPANKQKVTLAFSHDIWPDTNDWWILNSGNPHTAGNGRAIDDPKFNQEVVKAYTYLTITNMEVPDEYDFFSKHEDWLLAIVGDEPHPIKDNMGRGYLIGYWSRWTKAFYFNNILVWRALGSPRVNRVCLDLDQDAEFDDKRLTRGDVVTVDGMDWVVGLEYNGTAVNITFFQAELNYTRYYYPVCYDLSSIPPSASGLYHFGVISVYNKPSFTKDYKVILRDSVVAGEYDEAYIWNGTHWNYFPDGSTWREGTNLWVIKIEEDFMILTRKDGTTFEGLSDTSTVSLVAEGDFVAVTLTRDGPSQVSVTPYFNSEELEMVIFDDSFAGPYRIVFGTWGSLRETSAVYHALALGEGWLEDQVAIDGVHSIADLCQQAIKYNKVYNSVVQNKLNVQAWYRNQAV